jgi:peroxiredoxin Q/BCP
MALKMGARAPDFTLPSGDGRSVSLSDFAGKKTVVLYFYPKDETPGCTAEACSFRDNHSEFVNAGAEVIGVSADAPQSHEKFAAKNKLPFMLLSDASGDARAAYGIKSAFGIFPARITFVIDRRGTIRYVFDSMLRFQAHVVKALEIVKSLEAEAVAPSPPVVTGSATPT